jgi:tRNA A-37 threonylcarbamoyl transferase component Bud32
MTGAAPRYRIVRRLGQGGMAEVFEAELIGELGFVRKVAIKQLRPEALRDPVAARRFVDESRIASRLHHANIVSVLDVGVIDDRPFQVLELVDGLDAQALASRLGGALPIELALIIAHAVAHALDHAHGAIDGDGRALGIVHRDVKPANILVAWTGDVKLADFGIAVAHDRAAYTETGAVAGTRGFLAPEQRLRGELDGRSDVFALGLTLHALCTGGTPLADPGAELRLLGGGPLALDPALPDDVRAVIEPAVRPDRRDRPTAAAFAAALGHALGARQVRDARSALRVVMVGLQGGPRRQGALDQLLGVELARVDDGGPVQRYETVLREARPGAADADRPIRAGPPRRIATGWRAAALGGAAAALAGGALLRSGAAPGVAAVSGSGDQRAAGGSSDRQVDAGLRDRQPARGSGDRQAVSGSDDRQGAGGRRMTAGGSGARQAVGGERMTAVGSDDRPTAGGAGARAAAGGAGDARGSSVSSPVTGRGAGDPARGGVASRQPAGARPATSPPRGAAVARGYVQVVGEELLRAQVFIDGVAVGYVPNRFAVAVGHHRVEVERPDGVRLPPRDIEVTGFHTASNPARLRW